MRETRWDLESLSRHKFEARAKDSCLRFRLVLLLAAVLSFAADWPQFRGPGGTGVSPEKGLPTHWGPSENVRWKIALPGRGVSCPVIAAGRVYVTACSGYQQRRLHVLCFDETTGRQLW